MALLVILMAAPLEAAGLLGLQVPDFEGCQEAEGGRSGGAAGAAYPNGEPIIIRGIQFASGHWVRESCKDAGTRLVVIDKPLSSEKDVRARLIAERTIKTWMRILATEPGYFTHERLPQGRHHVEIKKLKKIVDYEKGLVRYIGVYRVTRL